LTRQKIIIDTDPGQDDAVAILVALASDQLEVLGITCVAGNVELELTTANALKICELAQRPEINVYAGSDKPLSRKLITAKHVHGSTGLDGTNLPDPTIATSKTQAVDFIVDTLASSDEKQITLCALGPLTNIAKAFRQRPCISKSVKKIVLMGGGLFEGGNITPAAEFNIYVDPEAASEVLATGVEIVMVPLDVTHKVLTSPNLIQKFENLGTKTGKAVSGLLDFFGRYDSKKYGSTGAPLHDANVIVYLLRPDFYQGKFINVEVETVSNLTRGMTVADWWQVTDRKQNAFYVKDALPEKVLGLIIEKIALLP
jgi:purine nucleosidase